MTIEIEYETENKLPVRDREIIEAVVKEALDSENCPYDISLNVLLTDNEAIQEINKEQRGMDMPTDVLSFPMIEYSSPADFSLVEDCVEDYFHPETGELLLGDIVISVDKVLEQAENYRHSIKRELAFLTAHSMLHLFGYDHMQEERVIMEQKQRAILERLAIGRDTIE